VGPLELPNFLSEISAFNTQLSTFTASIEQVSHLHNAALQSTSESDTTGYSGNASSRLEAAIAESSAQARALKDFLKSLERDMLLTERDGDYDQGRTKRGQVDKARASLQAALREFEKVCVYYPCTPLLPGADCVAQNRPSGRTGPDTTSFWRGNTGSCTRTRARRKSRTRWTQARRRCSHRRC